MLLPVKLTEPLTVTRLIVMENVPVELPLGSDTATVKLDVPELVGVPLIVPVAEAMNRFVGSVPELMAKVGLAQPLVTIGWE